MMPVYMDSYPHQRNQVPFGQYSGYDGIPYQMMVDQAKFPVYGPWPGCSNYGYIMPCHACSNHGNFPAFYSFTPSFSDFTPSPSLQSCGHHAVFSEPYPGHYSFPPRPSVEQLRYEYDKEAQRDYHCCGCPNHTCNWRSDKGVKIEEQEPDIVKNSDSLVANKLKNSPYPIMWIPPEYMKRNNEYGRPFESEMGDNTKISCSAKSHETEESSVKEPRGWNGWFPPDSLKSLMQDEDWKSTCNQQNEDKMSQLPYPIIWMPSNDVKEEAENKDQRKMNGWFPLDMNGLKYLMQGEDDKGRPDQQNEDKIRQFPYPIIWMRSDDVKEEAEKDQRKMNSWFPLDMNGLKSLMHGENDKAGQNQQNEDKMRQLPHPIIWMPSNSWQEQTEKEKRDINAVPNADKSLSNFKFIPVKTPEIDDSRSKPACKKNSCGQAESSQMMESNPKTNLGKKVDVRMKEDNAGEPKEASDASSKYAETKGTHSSKGSSVRKQSSPQKTSRLPPVCLRVEPLTRKKSTNGGSRSPSPPGFNGRSQEKTEDSYMFSASSTLKGNTLEDTQAPGVPISKSEEVEPKNAEKKVAHIVDGKTCETKNEDRSGFEMENSVKLPIDCQEDMSKKSTIKEIEKGSDECKLEKNKSVGRERDTEAEIASEAVKTSHPAESADVECRRKMNLSDVEAAMLIQSAYRGFVLRKMEPLKKLKEMAEVREQVAKIRKHLQALESSDLQKNARERDGIGEMIMRLLLKLDTIQGLHPSLRDIRKSLARELISLLEKLDSLVTKSSEETKKPADEPSIETHSDISMQEMQCKEAVIVENSFGTSVDNSINVKEQEQDQLFQMVHSESSVADKQHGRCENEIRELAPIDVESQVAESAPNMESEDNAANGEHDADQVVVTEREVKNGEHADLEQSVQLTLVAEEKMSAERLVGELPQDLCHNPRGAEAEAKVAKESDGINVDDDQVDELRELPLNFIDEPAVFKLQKNEVVGKGGNEIIAGEMESNKSSVPNLFTDVGKLTAEVEVDNKIMTTRERETNLLAELPLGVIKNDSAVSAFEKHIEIWTGKNEPLCKGVVEVDNKVTTSQEPETNLLAELPLGLIEDDSAVSAFLKHEKIETVKNEALCVLGASHNVAADANAQTEAEDLAKFMLEELPTNAVLEVEEIQPVLLVTGKDRSDEVGLDEERNEGLIDDDHMPSLKSAVIDVSTRESEERKEEDQDHKANGKEEEQVPQKKAQWEEPRCVIDNDKVDELPRESESESTKEFCANGTEAEQVPEKKAQREEPRCVIDNDKVDEQASGSESESTKEYVSVAMPIPQTSIDERDMITEKDKKLIEENARLREMMGKLMEAGKEQLTLISNLTGRVKDLERKLSRKRKQRARRYKKSPLTASATELSTDSTNDRVVNVVM